MLRSSVIGFQSIKSTFTFLPFRLFVVLATLVDNIDATELRGRDSLQFACRLLEVNENELLSALTTRTIFTRGDTVSTTLAATASMDVRDAFVKGIYGRMFVGIISRINVAIYRPSTAPRGRTSIGVLDIFGFEDFSKNRQAAVLYFFASVFFVEECTKQQK